MRIVLFIMFLLAARIASSQEIDPELIQRMIQIKQWVRAFEEWKEYDAEWLNRLHPDTLIKSKRKKKPAPPDWLQKDCTDQIINLEQTETLTTLDKACKLLVEHDDDLQTTKLRRQMQAARIERINKTSLWKQLHLDAGSIATSYGADIYGLIGTHLVVAEIKRFEVFGPPGLMVLSRPDSTNNRKYELAYTWGFGIRLFDFRMPGLKQTMTAHFTMVKAWCYSSICANFF